MATTVQYILDTNVLVALLRNGALGQHIDSTYGLRASAQRPLVSVVSDGELRSLARQFGWGAAKQAQIPLLMANLVLVGIESDDVLNAYAEIDAATLQAGQKMGENDVWIAATAKAAGAKLLTTDKDFDKLCPASAAYVAGLPAIDRDWIDPRLGKPKSKN